MPAASVKDRPRGSSTRGSLLGRLQAAETALADLTAELVPERIPGHQVVEVVRRLRRIERLAGGPRLVLADAVAQTGRWRQDGYASPEAWAAAQDGTTQAAAKADLTASKQLGDLPQARDAVSKGEVSAEAARAAAEGATADPAAESDLVAKAKKGDLRDTRDTARRAKQRRDERNGGQAAMGHYRRRALRSWLELDGEGRGSWNVPASYQAAFLAALEPYRAEAFKAAREAGRRESHEALMADAMYMLARDVLTDLDLPVPSTDTGGPEPGAGSGPGWSGSRSTHPDDGDARPRTTSASSPDDDLPSSATLFDPADQTDGGATATANAASDGPSQPPTTGTDRRPEPDQTAPPPRPSRRRPRSDGRHRRAPAQVHVHVDYDALCRGYAKTGETCEIEGLGPVPVAFARFLTNDAVLHVVLTGTDVTVVSSQRRYVPASIRRALEARDRTCVVPGCNRTHHLEMDHWTHDFAAGCPTSLATLARLCRFHHQLKTHAGWRLTGGPGRWQFHPPPRDPDEPP